MKGGSDDVIRTLVRELQDVFAEIGFDGFQLMRFQALIEMDLLAGHRFRFHQHMDAALLCEIENEIGGLLASAAVHNVAAVGDYVGFELFEVVIEVLDGVLLDRVGFVAQILVVGESVRADDIGAMIDQTAGSSVDRELQTRIVDRLPNARFGGVHCEARTSARCMVRMGRPARSMTPWSCIRQLESMETTVDAPVF